MTRFIKVAVTLISPALLCGVMATAQVPTKPRVVLKVDAEGSTERESGGGRGRGKPTTTQTKFLKIAVTNPNPKDLGEVTVTYWVFADDKDANQVVCVAKSEKKVSLGASKKEVIEGDKVKIASVGAHIENRKPVKASGQKYLGYAVQVALGSDIIGEAYDPKDMKSKTNLEAVSSGDEKKDAEKPGEKKDKPKEKEKKDKK
jgi:hypothetical protein